mgnify:CR=1 FL=1
MTLFIEKINFSSFLYIIKNSKFYEKIYYIDGESSLKFFQLVLIRFKKIILEKLDFKLLEIIEKDMELTQFKLTRETLYQIEKKILSNKLFNEYNNILNSKLASKFLLKETIKTGIYNENSFIRTLYLINVINKVKVEKNLEETTFLIIDRPWSFVYKSCKRLY